MSTFIATPATLWVVPSRPVVTTGQLDAPEPCNSLDLPPDDEAMAAVCLEHPVQDPPT